jgi:hypothetical protein
VHVEDGLLGTKVEFRITQLGTTSTAVIGDDRRAAIHFAIEGVERRSPETPRLYKVKINVRKDMLDELIGFRARSRRAVQNLYSKESQSFCAGLRSMPRPLIAPATQTEISMRSQCQVEPHGNEPDRWTEQYQADIYRHQFMMLHRTPQLGAMSPWFPMDFPSLNQPLPGIQDEFSRKRLISDQWQKKAPAKEDSIVRFAKGIDRQDCRKGGQSTRRPGISGETYGPISLCLESSLVKL